MERLIRIGMAVFAFAAAVLLPVGDGARGASPEVVRVGVWQVPPFAMRDNGGAWSGLTVELWEEVADRRGLRYEFREFTHHHQLFEALDEKKIDVALSDIPITHKYGSAVEYSRAFFHSNLAVAGRVKGRSVLERVIHALTSPGVLTVIGGLGFLVVLGSVFFWFLEKHEDTLLYRGEHRKFNFFNGIMWAILLITAQEPDIFKNDSFIGRVIAMVLLFIGVTVSASYIALITSALTVAEMKTNIHDVSDLPYIRVAALADSRATDYLNEHHISHKEFETLADAIEAVEKKDADAMVADEMELRFHIRHHMDHDLSVLPIDLEAEYYAIAYSRGSDLVKMIDPAISAFIRSPGWREIRRRYIGERNIDGV